MDPETGIDKQSIWLAVVLMVVMVTEWMRFQTVTILHNQSETEEETIEVAQLYPGEMHSRSTD